MLTGFAGSIAAESARQLDVEGGKGDVAHALEGSLDRFLAGCRDRDAA